MADCACSFSAGGHPSKKVGGLIRPFQDHRELNPSTLTISEETKAEVCTVSELKIHSKHNCYVLGAETMSRLQNEVSVSAQLEPGTTLIKIREGSFDYRGTTGHGGEPLVMLWIYGGKVINQKTGIPVVATWSTLNGYDDALTLEVLEPATLCAFFFDTGLEDNDGEVQLSIVRI